MFGVSGRAEDEDAVEGGEDGQVADDLGTGGGGFCGGEGESWTLED